MKLFESEGLWKRCSRKSIGTGQRRLYRHDANSPTETQFGARCSGAVHLYGR